MIVVSDTSPILNLTRIGRLEILPALYGQVLIPPGVEKELRGSGRDLPTFNLASLAWLTVAAARDRAQVQRLLDPGFLVEVEVVAELP